MDKQTDGRTDGWMDRWRDRGAGGVLVEGLDSIGMTADSVQRHTYIKDVLVHMCNWDFVIKVTIFT